MVSMVHGINDGIGLLMKSGKYCLEDATVRKFWDPEILELRQPETSNPMHPSAAKLFAEWCRKDLQGMTRCTPTFPTGPRRK
jgi:hypothetical protein